MKPEIDNALAALIDAVEILNSKRSEVCNGPLAVFKYVDDAYRYVDKQLDTMMRGYVD